MSMTLLTFWIPNYPYSEEAADLDGMDGMNGMNGADKRNSQAAARDPRLHVNEEPRNDLGDLMNGFFGMTTFMAIVFFGMVIVKFLSE